MSVGIRAFVIGLRQISFFSLFLSSFIKFRSMVPEEWSKMFQPIRCQGGHLCFLIGPKNHRLDRQCWVLASCLVLSNSAQQLQRSQTYRNQTEARAAIVVLRSARKYINLVEDVKILLLVKFHSTLVIGSRGIFENVSANLRPGGHLVFRVTSKNKLGGGRWVLASCKVYAGKFRSAVSEK